jgi:hypothetical protein
MQHSIPTLCVALGLALLAGQAWAEGPPELDIDQTCKSAAGTQLGLSEKESRDGCYRSERAARDELRRRWSEFTLSAKSQCSKQAVAGGYPSYVETVTCLELATGTVPAQTGGGDSAGKSIAPTRAEGSKLTAEPSTRQRTNPIEVLDKKQ